MTVTTHLRNQILAAVGHAMSQHQGPLSVANTITTAVVSTIQAHASCTYCCSCPPDECLNAGAAHGCYFGPGTGCIDRDCAEWVAL